MAAAKFLSVCRKSTHGLKNLAAFLFSTQHMIDRFAFLQSQLPPSYLDFMREHDGDEYEGDLGDTLGWVVIWSRNYVAEHWHGAEMAEYVSDYWFPFGSDGGGEMLCFDLRSGDDHIVMLPYIGLSDTSGINYPGTFQDIVDAVRAPIAK